MVLRHGVLTVAAALVACVGVHADTASILSSMNDSHVEMVSKIIHSGGHEQMRMEMIKNLIMSEGHQPSEDEIHHLMGMNYDDLVKEVRSTLALSNDRDHAAMVAKRMKAIKTDFNGLQNNTQSDKMKLRIQDLPHMANLDEEQFRIAKARHELRRKGADELIQEEKMIERHRSLEIQRHERAMKHARSEQTEKRLLAQHREHMERFNKKIHMIEQRRADEAREERIINEIDFASQLHTASDDVARDRMRVQRQTDHEGRHDRRVKLPGRQDQLRDQFNVDFPEEKSGHAEYSLELIFEKHDRNQDGFLDMVELETLFENQAKSLYPNNRAARFEERRRMKEHVMHEADANHDMYITLEELKAVDSMQAITENLWRHDDSSEFAADDIEHVFEELLWEDDRLLSE